MSRPDAANARHCWRAQFVREHTTSLLYGLRWKEGMHQPTAMR